MKLLRRAASIALTRLALLPRMPGFALLFIAALIETETGE
jgi:hypothetical protein